MPAGQRVIRTTRGEVWVQVGRVQDRQLGELGIDGAFHDDGRFHPIPADAQAGYYHGQLVPAGQARAWLKATQGKRSIVMSSRGRESASTSATHLPSPPDATQAPARSGLSTQMPTAVAAARSLAPSKRAFPLAPGRHRCRMARCAIGRGDLARIAQAPGDKRPRRLAAPERRAAPAQKALRPDSPQRAAPWPLWPRASRCRCGAARSDWGP